MTKLIRFIGGEKGGVGKTLFTNIYSSTRKNTQLVDSDTVNPDLFRMNKSVLQANLLDPQVLLDFIQYAMDDDTHDEYIISLPARALESFIVNTNILKELKDYGINLSMVFIIDTVNGLDLFSTAKAALSDCINFDCIILNGGTGNGFARNDFTAWDKSAVKNGGKYKNTIFEPFSGKEIFLKDYRQSPIREFLTKLVSEILLQDLINDINNLPVIKRIIVKSFHSEITELLKDIEHDAT